LNGLHHRVDPMERTSKKRVIRHVNHQSRTDGILDDVPRDRQRRIVVSHDAIVIARLPEVPLPLSLEPESGRLLRPMDERREIGRIRRPLNE
jgi:hypothetical protein